MSDHQSPGNPGEPGSGGHSASPSEQPIYISNEALQRLENLVGDHSIEELSVPRHMPIPEGFLAKPKDNQVWPAIILLHDCWGLTDSIKRTAARLAKSGFVVHALDFYGGQVTSDLKSARVLSHMVEPDDVIKITEQTIHALKREWFVRCDKVGVIGFSLGGHYALLTACRLDGIAAVVDFCGRIPAEAPEMAKMTCPALVLGGDNDPWFKVEEIEKVKAAFHEYQLEGDVSIYKDARHAFFDNAHPEDFSPAAAEDAWKKTMEFLNRHLRGQAPEGEAKKFSFFKKKLSGAKEVRYGNGTLKISAAYRQDQPDGIYREYYLSGSLRTERQYAMGKLEGPAKEFYESGKLKAEAQYKEGALEGESRQYYESGTLMEQAFFRAGRPEGEQKFYYENGCIRSELYYKDGEKEGVCKEYYPSGLVWCQTTYELGQQKKMMVCGEQGNILWKQ